MKTFLFYFSSTGNSLSIAKDLARELGDTEIFSIPKVIHHLPEMTAERIGLIFPMYFGGLPNIVKKFIETLPPMPHKYVFAINDSFDQPFGILVLTQSLLKKRGIKMAAGFALKMPTNYIVMFNAQKKEAQERCFEREKIKIKHIAQMITQKARIIEKGIFILNWISSRIIYPIAASRFPTTDRYFWVDNKCTHCGICEKICPVANIKLTNGTPCWLHHCEHCLGCLQWCPTHAIQFGKSSLYRLRYRNPFVTLEEFK